MSEDNTIEYTIEENDNKPTRENKPNLTGSTNGLSGIPQDVLNKLPPSFFGNEDIKHGDALNEFMLKHKANMQLLYICPPLSSLQPSQMFPKSIHCMHSENNNMKMH